MQILDTDNLRLKAGQVFTGPDLQPRQNVYLEIKEGLITGIRKVGEAGPECRQSLDLSHCSLLPGPVDCHVHLALDGKDFQDCLAKWQSARSAASIIAAQLDKQLAGGITAVRDGGDRHGWVLANKRDHQARRPRVLASGQALRRKDMYGSFLGPGLAGENLAAAVSSLARSGADQIKVLVSGVVSFKEFGRVGPVQFKREELELIVREAGRWHLPVMAHANTDAAVQACILAGVRSIEHGYFITRGTLELMAEKQVWWVPTLAAVANQLRAPRAQFYSDDEKRVIEKIYKTQQEMLAIARELGVPLAVGTDAGASGVEHGRGFLQELELYREAGLSGRDILYAATIEGSRLLKLDAGLENGKPARFLAVAGDPRENLDALARPVAIALG